MSHHPGIKKLKTKTGARYQVRWRDQSGAQRAKTFRTLAEAVKFKADADHRRRTGSPLAKGADKVTFAEVAATWAASKNHRPSTARRRDGILENYLLPALGNVKLSKITHSMLQQLVADWHRDGLSANTIRNHVRTLSPILDRAVRDDLIPKNPAYGLELPKSRRIEPRSLTPDECMALIAVIGPEYSPVIETLLATGCRWAELEQMNVEDFDRTARTLRVRQSKTDAGVRTITLDEQDTLTIMKHLMATGRAGAPHGSPLFTSPTGKRLVYSNFRRRVFEPACGKAGLEGVTLHSLRRTHATMLVSAGHGAKAVQERMGHRSIQTTLTHYASATESDRQAAASAKSDYLARPKAKPRSEAV